MRPGPGRGQRHPAGGREQDAEPVGGVPAGLRPGRCTCGASSRCGTCTASSAAGTPTAATASSLAREPAVTIGVDDPVDHVSDLMAERRMWLLPVLDGRRLVGVIHYAIGAAKLSPRALASHRTPTAS